MGVSHASVGPMSKSVSKNGKARYRLDEIRKAAERRLNSVEFPGRGLEDYRFMDLQGLKGFAVDKPYPIDLARVKASLCTLGWSHDEESIVIVDGVLSPEL